MERDQALTELLAKQEIHDALLRYCRGVDRADGDLMRSAYHPDAIDNHGIGGSAKGWDMAKAYGDSEPVWLHSQHRLGNVLIEVNGDLAASEAYLVGYHRFEHDGTQYDFVSAGRYVDRWERRDGAFRIAERHVVWDYVRTDRVTDVWPGPDSEIPKAYWGGDALATDTAHYGQYSKDDYSYRVFESIR